jgi:lysophospholipase L1-like esterase
MRIGILGNSDTTGQKLQPGEKPWPELLRERLPDALGAPVTVDSWKFAAYRPGSVEYALELVDAAEPDVVIVTLASYWCAFSTVQSRVEQRLGQRAGKLFNRAERSLTRRLEPVSPAAGRLAKRIARRVAGAQTLMTVEQFIDVFSQLIRELSKREAMDVLVLGDHHFTADLREKMPAIASAIRDIERAIRPLVQERRLHWGDLEAAISDGGRREEMILGDHVHMTPEAHERVARGIMPRLQAIGALRGEAYRAPTGSFASSANPS